MKTKTAVFAVFACCAMLCPNEQFSSVLTSPRAMLVYVLALWLRCEWCVQHRDLEEARSKKKIVGENYTLSQTVMILSDQHRLLCEIGNAGLKSLRYSKDTFAELRFPSVHPNEPLSFESSLLRAKSLESSLLRAKQALRGGSVSETFISMV